MKKRPWVESSVTVRISGEDVHWTPCFKEPTPKLFCSLSILVYKGQRIIELLGDVYETLREVLVRIISGSCRR